VRGRVALLRFLSVAALAAASFGVIGAKSGVALASGSSLSNGDLYAVSCFNSSSCMAVGYYVSSGSLDEPLAAIWNGTDWVAAVPALPSGDTNGELLGVSCPVATGCMAVGEAADGSGAEAAMADYWNGTSWTAAPLPVPASNVSSSISKAVSCVSTGSSTCLHGRGRDL